MSLASQLLDPHFTPSDPTICDNGRKMQTSTKAKLVKRYRNKSRKAYNSNQVAPLGMRQHMMPNQQKLDTSDAISVDIEAMEEFNREAKEQPRFVARGKGGDEGGKEKQKAKENHQGNWIPTLPRSTETLSRLLQLVLDNWPHGSTVLVYI